MKPRHKSSGSWQTLHGARTYGAIRSYILTTKKYNHDVPGGLHQLFIGEV